MSKHFFFYEAEPSRKTRRSPAVLSVVRTFRPSNPGELVDHVGAVDAAGVQLQRGPPGTLLRRRDQRKEEIAHGNTASHLRVPRWGKS